MPSQPQSRAAQSMPISQAAPPPIVDVSPGRHRRRVSRRAVPGASVLLVLEGLLPTLLLIAVVVATNLRFMSGGLNSFLGLRVTVKNVLLCLAFVGASIAILRACRVYDARAVRALRSEIARIFLACSLCAALALVFPLTSVSGGVRVRHLTYLWAGLAASELAIRFTRRLLVRRSRAGAPTRVIIAGTGPRALTMWADVTAHSSGAYELVGFVDVHRGPRPVPAFHGCSVDAIEDLEGILMRQSIDEVLIALPIKSRYREIQHVISLCERFGVRAKYRADMFTTWVAWPHSERGPQSVVTMNVVPDDYRLIFKRAFDIVGALAALVIFSPVMVVAAIAIKLTSRGPVLFSQERLGLNKRRFSMLKFRSMVPEAAEMQMGLEWRNEADGPVFKIADDPRITRVGRFLRKSSIDELPQLFNVLKGEMSLVGPRPLSNRDVSRFRRGTDMRRFSVKPGLTCLWQISGRSQLGFGEWIQLDLKYIDGWSLFGDLRILAWTIPAVLRGTGAM